MIGVRLLKGPLPALSKRRDYHCVRVDEWCAAFYTGCLRGNARKEKVPGTQHGRDLFRPEGFGRRKTEGAPRRGHLCLLTDRLDKQAVRPGAENDRGGVCSPGPQERGSALEYGRGGLHSGRVKAAIYPSPGMQDPRSGHRQGARRRSRENILRCPAVALSLSRPLPHLWHRICLSPAQRYLVFGPHVSDKLVAAAIRHHAAELLRHLSQVFFARR